MLQHFALAKQRVMAILAALIGFCYLIQGFTNRQLVERVRRSFAAENAVPTGVGRFLDKPRSAELRGPKV